jgi:hypothetical protein
MSAGFDPYHKLLGIPPEEQPPNHYRLLGLSRKFEDDIEVIENCSNRVMQSLRQHQSGAHGPEIAKLLNEVSAARRTLLNADKKQAYDDVLRAEAAAAEEPFDDPESAIEVKHDDLLSKFKRRKNVFGPILGTIVLSLCGFGAYKYFAPAPVPVENVVEQHSVTDPGQVKPEENSEEKPAEKKDSVVASGGKSTATAKEITKPAPRKEQTASGLPMRSPGLDIPVPQRGQFSENLIPLVDPSKDGTEGDWVRAESAIESKSKKESILVFPFDSVPSSMIVEMEVEKLDDGPGELFVQLPTSVKPAVFGFDVGTPPRTGVYIDSDKLEHAPRTKQVPLFQTSSVQKVKFSVTGVAVSVERLPIVTPGFYVWGGDFRRLTSGPPDFPAAPRRIVLVTRGARFKIHSFKYSKTPESELPDPPATINGSDLISVITQSRDAERGDWGYSNRPVVAPSTPFGRLQVPVAVPDEYDLSVSVEIPDDHGEVVVGLPVQNRTVSCYLNSRQCSTSAGPQAKSFNPEVFPPEVAVQFDFQVRKDSIAILKNGSRLYSQRIPATWKAKPDEFSIPWLNPDEQRRIFFGTTTSSYKINGIGMAANSGTNVASSIRPTGDTPTLAGNTVMPPDRPGFKRPEGGLAGMDEEPLARDIPKVKEPAGPDYESALSMVKTQFKSELQRKKPADKLVLAERLKNTAAGEPADSAIRFVLLQQIIELAAAAGEPKLALETIEELATSFESDAFKLKIDALKALSKSTKDPEKIMLVLESLSSLAQQSSDLEKYNLAVELYGLASGIGTRAKLRPITEEANELKREMLERQEHFVKVEAARKTLLVNPADGDAQLVIGEYLSLTRNDWNAGLPALRQSANPELKTLAERDLAQPSTPPEQGQLAKDWLTYAQSGSSHEHAAYADRAVFWLTLAFENSQGLEQKQLQITLREAVAVRDWDQPYGQLLEKLGRAVAGNRISKTSTIGATWSNTANFEDLPEDPGLLIGFDLRIKSGTYSFNGQQTRTETVEIIRPVFQTATGTKPFDNIDADVRGNARIVHLRARKGYAVSGLRMQVAGNIYRLSVVYRKITSKGLDPERGYWSEVLGSGAPNSTAAKVSNIDTRGVPVVGISGSRSKNYERGNLARRISEISFVIANP